MRSARLVRRLTLTATAVLCATASVWAMYAQVEVENVPIERLVKNLEQLIAQKPKDAGLRINLARVHAMAFALKTETAPVWKGNEGYGVWFGYEPKLVPYQPVATTDAKKLEAAKAHLTTAIATFDEAIKLEPGNLIAALGRAWCIEQSGDKPKAIASYRDLIAKSWATEQNARGLPPGGQSVTAEASGYLIPLLDPVRDKAEIATLQARIDQIKRLPRAITPIAIPLRDGMDILDVVDHAARVRFDADGSGERRPWTWIGRDAGWLVYEQRGTRRIDSALQMFGSVTFWLFWDNGYDALRALDDNGDGTIAGAELAHMAIWRDANQNGVSDRGEVAPLGDWGIAALSCAYELQDDGLSAAWSRTGVTLATGATRPTWDVLLWGSGLEF